jgi:formimidoylglutamase
MAIEDPLWPRADQWLAAGSESPGLLLVGVPSSVASLSPSRADLAPEALRTALRRFSVFDSEHGVDLRSLPVSDQGDWDLSGLDMITSQEAIAERARLLPQGPVTVFIGGDNAITRPLARATGDLDRLGVLTLDAHHDVRGLDRGPSNGTPIRGLIADGLAGNRVAQVGIHSFANSAEYRSYCDEQGIAVFTMEAVEEWGVADTVAAALDHLDRRCDRVYLDCDMDVLDLAFAPGCPGARPGGMSPRQLAQATYVAGRHPKVGWADFVEVDPTRDPSGVTVMNMAAALLSFCAGVASR